MVNLQGLDVCVNLKNGDIIYGTVTDMDDEDGSISLEKVERCFASGRKSDYPFMKIPGHIILNYNPKTTTEMPRQQQQQPQQQPPTQVSQPSSTMTAHLDTTAITPTPDALAKSCSESQGPSQKDTFVDPAIISITSEKKPVTEKRSKKQQHSPGSAKSNKTKKDSQHLDDANVTAETKPTKTSKSGKSKRGNKSKQQQQQQPSTGDVQEDDEVNKSVKSLSPPATTKSSPAKGKNANKQSKKQRQQQQQHEQPLEQEQLSPPPQSKLQQKPPQQQQHQQHVIPQFGNQISSRKVVETVELYDFDEFATTTTTSGSKKTHPPCFADEQQQLPAPTFTMPEPKKASKLHKPDDAVNQAATQSLLSSLNMVGAFPSSASHSSHDSVSYHQHPPPPSSILGYTSSPPPPQPDNTFALNMPFPIPRPTIYTGDTTSASQGSQGATSINDQDEKGTTPTKTMVPLLDDGSPATAHAHDSTTTTTTSNNSITSPPTSMHATATATKTYVLQPEQQPAEKLQKPMEEVDSEPVLTYKKNDNHANAYDGPIIRSVATGTACPVLSVELLSRLIQLTKSEAGLNESMMIENAAHATTSITFKMIGGQRRVQQQNHNDAPIVVILAGSHMVGTYGIATARHLANRGIQVVVLLVSAELDPSVKKQKRCAQFAGVTFVDSVDELPDPLTAPVDLIIDAMMGSSSSMHDLKKNHIDRTLLWQSMDWSNGNKAPILSLDYPSGVNHEDGHPFHVMHYILPKWTICFGAPIQGCVSNKVTGGLFVADIGIPAVSWQRIGIKGRGLPWGVESVIPLEYE